MKITYVVGTRPNFVKIAPLINETKKAGIDFKIIHTGQHYDNNLSKSFFNELEIPKPDVNLDIHSSTPKNLKIVTAKKCAYYLGKIKPDLVMVVGDSDATCAGAMAAKAIGVKLAHVEAGLRSFYMAMPEEVNRLYIDKVADYLFVSEPSGLNNLKASNAKGKVFFVGNVMIDTLKKNLNKIKSINNRYKRLNYAVATLHRKSNIHSSKDLQSSFEVINHIADNYIHLIFPMHPRTAKNISEQGINLSKNIEVIEPLSYLNMQNLILNSKFVVTDSGGLQDETTFYKKPCITLRENTERPITFRIGSSVLTGLDKEKIESNIKKIMSGKFKKGRAPKYWDGKTAWRIVKILKNEYENGNI